MLAPISQQFLSPARVLRPRYWRWLSSVRRQLRHGAPSDLKSIRSYLVVATELGKLETWLTEHADTLSAEIPTANLRDPAALLTAAKAMTIAAQLRTLVPVINLPTPASSPYLTPEIRQTAKALVTHLEDPRWKRALEQIEAAWPAGFVNGIVASEAPLPRLVSRCNELLAALSAFHEWFVCNTRCAAA